MHVTARSLGILGKLITGPWMRLLGVETTILGMNKHFQEALGNITAWSHDASSLIRPNAPCAFSCIDVKRFTVFHSLVDRTDFNGEAILLLQTLCKACVEVMERSQIIFANKTITRSQTRCQQRFPHEPPMHRC